MTERADADDSEYGDKDQERHQDDVRSFIVDDE